MAEFWIRVHANLRDKPVVDRCAHACGVRIAEASGLLVSLWGALSQHGTKGSIRDVSDAQLERWAGWEGKRGKFAAFVRAQHCDADGRVNDWDEYNSALELERERNRKKAQAHRDRQRSRVTDVVTDIAGHVTGTSPSSVPVTSPEEYRSRDRDVTGISRSREHDVTSQKPKRKTRNKTEGGEVIAEMSAERQVAESPHAALTQQTEASGLNPSHSITSQGLIESDPLAESRNSTGRVTDTSPEKYRSRTGHVTAYETKRNETNNKRSSSGADNTPQSTFESPLRSPLEPLPEATLEPPLEPPVEPPLRSPAAASSLASSWSTMPAPCREFLTKFYPRDGTDADRRADVARQILATLNGGAQLRKGERVYAYTAERLATKCREVLAEGVADRDKAIVVLLKKLGDTSDGSAPGAVAAAEQARTAELEQHATEADYAIAQAWIAERPDVETSIAEALEREGFGSGDLADMARRIARRGFILRAYRAATTSAGAPE